MEQRGNDHVDWWRVSVEQHREITKLRDQIEMVFTALPVLKTMCEVAGLHLGAKRAQEMIEELKAMTEETILTEMLPCPFCGGEAQISEKRMSPTMKGPGALITVDIMHWCEKVPGCVHTHVEIRGRDRQSALNQWNKRVSQWW